MVLHSKEVKPLKKFRVGYFMTLYKYFKNYIYFEILLRVAPFVFEEKKICP